MSRNERAKSVFDCQRFFVDVVVDIHQQNVLIY